ncbi:MAG: DEAD/DEAH box helicase [Acidobacteriota bacterium]
MSFSASKLHPALLRGIDDLGFLKPTPIQRDAIPPALEGRDVLACAMTGSGKTAAFLLPILQRLMQCKRGTTRALVVTPTRELAAQIVEHFQALAKHTKLRAAAVYGGVGFAPQEKAFRQGVDLIVACPGRLLDHFKQPYAKLTGLEVLVLDEADRMLDMGFLPDIRRVLRHLPPRNQTLFFSATMPRPIVELSRELLQNPVRINVERRAAPATGVTQAVFQVRQDLKSILLFKMLEQGEIDNVLVFTRTKHRANRLAQYLSKRGVPCDRIHGNRTQAQRTRALSNFKHGKIQVLVATDIAARGIDVEALSHVVNFDVPHLPEDYIHRVGRTARAQATGEAFTFCAPQEAQDMRAIERAVGKRIPRRQLEGFDNNAKPDERLEIPLAERIATIRARKAEERARSRAKAARKEAARKPRPAADRAESTENRGQRPPAGPRKPQAEERSGAQPGGRDAAKPAAGRRPRRRRRRRRGAKPGQARAAQR